MNRILFTCLGNICRSPLMEGVARARWDGATPVEFDSAGVGDWHVGEPPDPRAIAVAARHGIDIGGQRARAVRSNDFTHFDLILCADRSVLSALRARAPAGARARLALYLAWTGVAAGEAGVPDPYAGGRAEFDAVYALVVAGSEGLVAKLRAEG
ncbi:MAG: low molecular weight protein-tyrosine-phosphatase [Arenimonas sp.]